jgi:hypothetical protein
LTKEASYPYLLPGKNALSQKGVDSTADLNGARVRIFPVKATAMKMIRSKGQGDTWHLGVASFLLLLSYDAHWH